MIVRERESTMKGETNYSLLALLDIDWIWDKLKLDESIMTWYFVYVCTM